MTSPTGMFEKVSRSLKYDSKTFFDHNHTHIYYMDTSPGNPLLRHACAVYLHGIVLHSYMFTSQTILLIVTYPLRHIPNIVMSIFPDLTVYYTVSYTTIVCSCREFSNKLVYLWNKKKAAKIGDWTIVDLFKHCLGSLA